MAVEATCSRGSLHLTLLAVFFLVTYNEHVTSTPSKSFRRATNRDITDLCLSGQIDAPYATITVDKLDLPKINIDCPPPDTLCSWKCTMDANCTSFVWKANTNLCEFYSSASQTCAAISDGIHFEVYSICGQASFGTEGYTFLFSITVDNEVKHLYVDGCELTDLPNGKVWEITDNVTISLTTIVIAVEMRNDAGGVGGLLASTDTICTDGTWKVTTNYTSGWMDINFDDSTWNNATTYGYNGVGPWNTQPAMSNNAQWISTENYQETTVYFRYHLKRGDV